MSARETDRLARFSHWLGNLVPDATSASVILLAVVVVAALASGNSPATVGDAYYRGLWMLQSLPAVLMSVAFPSLFSILSTPLTFPLFTAIGSSIVAVFVPSSGGQWVVQGYVTAKAAVAIGSTAQPVLLAGIARVDFRTFFGYGVVFALLWFTLGVGIFTFVP
jgi:short subunit fatty acids transporter